MTNLVERLRAYRPTDEWGEGVHHGICTEAADEITRLTAALGEREGAVAIWSGEHRAYWRRGENGAGANYTLNLDSVGLWSRADAVRLTSHCGPEKMIVLHDRPDAMLSASPAPQVTR